MAVYRNTQPDVHVQTVIVNAAPERGDLSYLLPPEGGAQPGGADGGDAAGAGAGAGAGGGGGGSAAPAGSSTTTPATGKATGIGLALFVIGVVIAVILFGTDDGPTFKAAEGLGAFAIFYVAAQ